LMLAELPAEDLALTDADELLVERAPGEPERRRADCRAENVESRHGDAEAVAGRAQEMARRHAALLKGEGRQWVRLHHLDALGDRKAGRLSMDDEGRKALGAGRFAGAGEDDIVAGNAAVGNPGLPTLEHEMVAVAPRGGPDRRHIGAAFGLGERK